MPPATTTVNIDTTGFLWRHGLTPRDRDALTAWTADQGHPEHTVFGWTLTLVPAAPPEPDTPFGTHTHGTITAVTVHTGPDDRPAHLTTRSDLTPRPVTEPTRPLPPLDWPAAAYRLAVLADLAVRSTTDSAKALADLAVTADKAARRARSSTRAANLDIYLNGQD